MKRYLVLTMRTPQFDPDVIQAHRAHLDALNDQGLLEAFGPFTDQSGGAYLIRSESLEQAYEVAMADPVHLTGSSKMSVYEWDVTQCMHDSCKTPETLDAD